MVVLGDRSYFRHTCLAPDAGWRDSGQHSRNVVSVGRMHPVIIRNSHSVIQFINIQLFSVQARSQGGSHGSREPPFLWTTPVNPHFPKV